MHKDHRKTKIKALSIFCNDCTYVDDFVIANSRCAESESVPYNPGLMQEKESKVTLYMTTTASRLLVWKTRNPRNAIIGISGVSFG